MGIGALRSFEGLENDLVSMESFWRQNVLCAVAANHIASRRSGGRPVESAFIAGLLHDIGELVLYLRAPASAREALLLSLDAPDDREAYLFEREIMGFDHGVLGSELAKQWGLPAALQECIEYHHEPERATAHPIDVAIVHVANSVGVLAEVGSLDLEDAPPIRAVALKRLGLSSEDLPGLVQKTIESAPELLALLGAGADPLPQPSADRVL
jgi:HD-like signal output (HDOD) protein